MEQVVKNAKCLAEELKKYGFRIVSGGTDNHLLVADLRGKNITGKLFQDALDSVGITVNKNMIPFDPEKPSVTSGVAYRSYCCNSERPERARDQRDCSNYEQGGRCSGR